MKSNAVSVALLWLTLSIANAETPSPSRQGPAANADLAAGFNTKTCLYRDKPTQANKRPDSTLVLKVPANTPCPETAPDRAVKVTTKAESDPKKARPTLKAGALIGERQGTEQSKTCLYQVNGAVRPVSISSSKLCPANKIFP